MNSFKDQEQATYTAATASASVDLTEIIATYNLLLAGDSLPERIAVQTVDLRALLDAAASTVIPRSSSANSVEVKKTAANSMTDETLNGGDV